MIKQHLTSGEVSKATQFMNMIDNYICLSKIITSEANNPKMDVDAPTDL